MIKTITTDTFEQDVINSEKPVLVEFSADWCGPCRALKPTVEKLAEDMKEEIVVGEVDVDTNMDLMQQYLLRSVPTLILFKDGKEAGKQIGAVSEKMLKEFVDNALSKE